MHIYALYSINLLASFASLGFSVDFSFALYSIRVVVVLAAALRSSRLLAHLFCYTHSGTHTRIHAHTDVAATPTVPVICLSLRHIQVLQVCVYV